MWADPRLKKAPAVRRCNAHGARRVGVSPQKPAAEFIRDKLTAEQYRVTQESGTERAFTGEFWDKFEKGIYVDVVTGVRYCINSAALRFVPYEKMETEGYGYLLYLFDK